MKDSMSIKILLEYSSNINKSGRMFLEDNDGNKVALGEAVLPESIHQMKSYTQKGLQIDRYIKENLSPSPQKSNLFDDLGDHFLIKNSSGGLKIPIVSTKKFTETNNIGYADAITISEKSMQYLLKLAKNENFDIEGKRQMFILGVNQAERINSSRDNLIYAKINYGIQLEEEYDKKLKKEQESKIFERKKIYDDLKPKQPKANTNQTIKNSSEIRLDKTLGQSPSVKNKNLYTPPMEKNLNSYHISNNNTYQRNSYPNHRYSNNDAVSPLDIMFMTSFPELSPIYKPDSAIAWLIYFNNEHNKERLLNHDTNCIKNIPGFEAIQSYDIIQKRDGSYQVEIFADLDKREKIGSLSCDSNQNLIIDDSKGTTTFACKTDDNLGFKATTNNDKGANSSLEVVPDIKGSLVGNWSIEGENFSPISSAVSFNKSFSAQNIDIGNPILIEKIQPSMTTLEEFSQSVQNNVIEEINQKFDSRTEESYKFDSLAPEENKYDSRYELPPPPPPPPDDSYQFTTSDPYSRGASFSM